MKTPAFFSAAVLAASIMLGGCAQQPTIAGSHVSSGARTARTFALSVTLPDGSQITPQQWATVKTAFQLQLAAAGYTLVDDISLADRIIRVVFTPAVDDPSNGTATVLSVRPNPAYAFNSSAPIFASYGYSPGFGLPYNSLYGYNNYNDYSYSYSGGSSTVTPRCDPPNHNRPNHPVDCQPGTTHDGGQFAHHGGDGSHRGPGPSDTGSSGRWSSSRSADSGSGFSSSSYSSGSSSYSGPTVSGYSSSSNSLPSASFSSGSSGSSYSSGSSSFSSPSSSSSDFSSSSSSSSAGSSSTGATTVTSSQNAN
jgi:hypothetical protein